MCVVFGGCIRPNIGAKPPSRARARQQSASFGRISDAAAPLVTCCVLVCVLLMRKKCRPIKKSIGRARPDLPFFIQFQAIQERGSQPAKPMLAAAHAQPPAAAAAAATATATAATAINTAAAAAMEDAAATMPRGGGGGGGAQGLPIELLQHVRTAVVATGGGHHSMDLCLCVCVLGSFPTQSRIMPPPHTTTHHHHHQDKLTNNPTNQPTRSPASARSRTRPGSTPCARAGTTGWARRPRRSIPRY